MTNRIDSFVFTKNFRNVLKTSQVLVKPGALFKKQLPQIVSFFYITFKPLKMFVCCLHK